MVYDEDYWDIRRRLRNHAYCMLLIAIAMAYCMVRISFKFAVIDAQINQTTKQK